MTLLTATLFFLVNCATSLSWARGRPDDIPEDANRVKVDRVVGGDTIVLIERTRVRLHGIEAPECDQPYGPMATTLYHSKNGFDINASLVCAGYAWWYEKYAPGDKQLENCQNRAR